MGFVIIALLADLDFLVLLVYGGVSTGYLVLVLHEII